MSESEGVWYGLRECGLLVGEVAWLFLTGSMVVGVGG